MTVQIPIIVMAFETDYGGVVSNTRYLEYLERGRAALIAQQGLSITQIWDEHGVQPVVRRVEVNYLGFARHEDSLLLQTRVAAHSGATTLVDHELIRPHDEAIILRARQTLAYLNTRWRPVRVPAVFRDALPTD